jgi:anthranilate phosphoribosyltransferase
MAEALRAQGLTTAWVVHGDGMDELTTTAPSEVTALDGESITRFTIDPAELGLARAAAGDLRGGAPEENALSVRRVLAGETGAHRDIVLLNAAAALVVAGVANDLADGMARAITSIDDGHAQASLDALIRVSQRHAAAAADR